MYAVAPLVQMAPPVLIWRRPTSVIVDQTSPAITVKLVCSIKVSFKGLLQRVIQELILKLLHIALILECYLEPRLKCLFKPR